MYHNRTHGYSDDTHGNIQRVVMKTTKLDFDGFKTIHQTCQKLKTNKVLTQLNPNYTIFFVYFKCLLPYP